MGQNRFLILFWNGLETINEDKVRRYKYYKKKLLLISNGAWNINKGYYLK